MLHGTHVIAGAGDRGSLSSSSRAGAILGGVRWLAVALALLVFLAGFLSCAPPPAGPAISVYDSLGVEIIDFDLDRVPELGSVEAEPTWIFGATLDRESGVALGDIRDARLLRDGRVAVINGMAEEVLLIGPDIGEWESLGRRGRGPGEFEYVTAVSEAEGRIWVYDGFANLLLTFQDGGFVESRKPPSVRVPGPVYPEVVIPDGGGFYVGDAYLPPDVQAGLPVRRLVLVARVEGEIVDTLTVIQGDTGIPKGVGLSKLPFGAGYAMVKGDSGVWVGDSALPEVRFWSRAGVLQRIVRWRSSQDRTLTRRRIDSVMNRALAGRPASVRSRLRRTWRNTDFPSDIPAWGTLIMGIDGILWISEYPGPEVEWPFNQPYPAQMWWGVDPAGRPVGKLVSPAGLRVTGIGGDFLIGIHRDALGVETVRRHRIVKHHRVAANG